MPWLPRWLGRTYAVLFSRFERGIFTFSEALKTSGQGEGMLSVAFSKLHHSGSIIVFARSKPRLYRLIDPRTLVLRSSGILSDVHVTQEVYTQLIYDSLRSIRSKINIDSFAVYGSVARGVASKTSDLDLLVVSDDFRGSLASRIDSLAFVYDEMRGELEFLRSYGYRTNLSFYPIRTDETRKIPIILLDMVQDAKIIYDRSGFLEGTLSDLRARLKLAGARRIEKGANSWYWDLADLRVISGK